MARRNSTWRRASSHSSSVLVGAAAVGFVVHCLVDDRRIALNTDFVGVRGAATWSGARHAGQTAVQAQAGTAPLKRWSLVLTPSDHYIWRDEAHFVSIVSDAGEWELDMAAIKAAWAAGQVEGSVQTGVEVFKAAPLYVVKDYVKELQSYGLRAEARETAVEELEGEEGKDAWRQRDWKTLSPDSKESAQGETAADDEKAREMGQQVNVMLRRGDHRVFDGSKGASMKFKAYVELATDAARRFMPEEALVNAMHAKLTKGDADARVAVLENISKDAADRAANQFKEAGFEVDIEPVVTK